MSLHFHHVIIKSVSISSTVEKIGDYAFYSCGSLNSIEVPANVTDIGYRSIGYGYFLDGRKWIYATYPGFTIIGDKDTSAEAYAVANGIAFDGIYEIGDPNGDGVTNIADIVNLQKVICGNTKLTPNQATACDLNNDGKIDVFDLILLKQMVAQA